MYGVVRQYRVDRDSIAPVVDRVREGFLPLISSAAGFVGYTVTDAAADGLITVSVFQDQAGAEESVRLAAGYIKENLASLLPNPPQVTSGEFKIREVRQDAQFGYGVMRRYQFDPGDIDELVRRVTAGLVPQITGAPGFASYSVLDGGNGVVVSLSAFADRASAEASHAQTLDWVTRNLAEFLKNPPEVIKGEIKLRQSKAAASAG